MEIEIHMGAENAQKSPIFGACLSYITDTYKQKKLGNIKICRERKKQMTKSRRATNQAFTSENRKKKQGRGIFLLDSGKKSCQNQGSRNKNRENQRDRPGNEPNHRLCAGRFKAIC